MSIADRPSSVPRGSAVSPAALSLLAALPQPGPITLAMYERMLAAGVFDPAEYRPLELISRAVIVFREPQSGGYESRATHRGEQVVTPLVCPQVALAPAELFLPG